MVIELRNRRKQALFLMSYLGKSFTRRFDASLDQTSIDLAPIMLFLQLVFVVVLVERNLFQCMAM